MRSMVGTVTSAKMEKTAVVTIERRWRHPLYKKIVRRSKKYLVHDELGVAIGEKVRIEESRPLSKHKRWKIVERIGDKKEEKKPKPAAQQQ